MWIVLEIVIFVVSEAEPTKTAMARHLYTQIVEQVFSLRRTDERETLH